MLTRVYGTAFAKKEELNEYLEYLANIRTATTTSWDVSWSCSLPWT